MAIEHIKTIGVVAGRSGGHIIPALTLTAHNNQTAKIILFTTNTDLDKKISEQYAGIVTIPLNLSNIPKKIWQYPLYGLRFMKTIFQSISLLHRYKPEKIMSMGGYISIPVCFAAWLLRIRIELYELNAIPGKSTTVLKYFATSIYVCYKKALNYFPNSKTHYTSYPVRFIPSLVSSKETMLEALALKPNNYTIFIAGGSQGSVFINNVIMQWLLSINNENIQIIHQTGHQDYERVKNFYEQLSMSHYVVDYYPTIEHFYQAADLIIARAGSGTLFEIVHFQKPAIIIPLELKSNNHQYTNAQALALEYPHLFHIFRQSELIENPQKFYDQLDHFVAGQSSGFSPRA